MTHQWVGMQSVPPHSTSPKKQRKRSSSKWFKKHCVSPHLEEAPRAAKALRRAMVGSLVNVGPSDRLSSRKSLTQAVVVRKWQVILKCVWKGQVTKLGTEQNLRARATWLQSLLKATEIKTVWYWRKDREWVMEQNRESRNRPTHVWSIDSRKRYKGNSMEKEYSFRQMGLKWLGIHREGKKRWREGRREAGKTDSTYTLHHRKN